MNQRNTLRIAALIAVASSAALSLGQEIHVVVNGEQVVFPGVGPQQVSGRILVPLRGVLEKLGAYVGWEPSTRTVTANKTGIDLQLKLGDRHGTLNGQDVTLDVPAQEFRGSTLVPLRFVGEALGADVKWDAATYTVSITTSTEGTTDPNQYTPPRGNVGDVAISSFDLDQGGTLRGGTRLKLTLVGTPGGTATFSIPGVVNDVSMSETSPGNYVGTFTVPSDSPLSVSKASAIARLRVGNKERMIQSGTSLGLDTQPPTIGSVTPETGSRVSRNRPNISAVFDDGAGSGVDPATVQVMVDDHRVDRDAQITSTFVSYRPDDALNSGRHTVRIDARDRAGNEVRREWNFTVTDRSDVIKSFTFDAGGQDLSPGSEVTFTLLGEPGGKASYSIGDRIVDRPLRETQPGKYVGTYTIRRNDNFESMQVSAKLVTTNDETFSYEAPTRFSTNVRTLEAPTFSEPQADARVSSPLVLRGTAAPGSRIHIKVDYSKTTLGVFRMTGTVADVEVTADDRGRFTTESIDLKTGLGSGETTFTVTAVTVGSNGKESTPTKLTLRK